MGEGGRERERERERERVAYKMVITVEREKKLTYVITNNDVGNVDVVSSCDVNYRTETIILRLAIKSINKMTFIGTQKLWSGNKCFKAS